MRAYLAVAMIAIVASHAEAAVEDDLRDGDKFFEEGDWKRAAAAYDRAIGKAPGQVSPEAYGKRAAIFIILKDYKGGLAFIEKAKARYPNAPEVGEQEALLLWESDQKEKAIAVAEVVVKAKPSAFTNQKIIGEYYATRDPVRTAAAFEGYLQHRPAELEGGDVLPRIRLGFAYLSTARSVLCDGNDSSAEVTYGKAAEQFEYVSRKLGKKPNAQVNADNGLCAAYAGLGRWDQAINVCEKIIQEPKHIDSSGSVWFNLAKAYLARKQTKKARSAANEFSRVRKNDARGFMLVGDTFFEDRDWGNALDQYLRAEKVLKPNRTCEQAELSIQLGKTYRRLPAPSSGPNKNVELAIEKLTGAFNANPANLELATELGGAYLEAKQDAKATALTDKLLSTPDIAKARAEQRAAVLMLAGKSLFNQKKLKEARQRFEEARQLRSADVQIQRALVTTINEQAFAEGKDLKAAQALLEQALTVDPTSPTTLTNIAVLAIDRGDCEVAKNQLLKAKDVRGSDAVVTHRLLARSFLCIAKPDVKRATEAFQIAEREAKKANAQLLLAEIYTEWAPLTWDTDLTGAVEKLELAATVSASSPEIAPAAKRNLALALYRRGWRLMRDGKGADAAADFERATRDPSVLKGTEPLAFDFSLALAQLDANKAADAAKLFRALGSKGNQGSYLKGIYAKLGNSFFASYANYRSQTGAARQQACGELGRVESELGPKGRELVSSCWEAVAWDAWRAGQLGAAQKAITAADKSGTPDVRRRLELDRAALSLSKDPGAGQQKLAPAIAALEAMNGNPVEALINLGIIYDLLGRPKDAYDAWTKAKAKGSTARDLQKWIDAKKRIYGY